jgi:hypothetical protein
MCCFRRFIASSGSVEYGCFRWGCFLTEKICGIDKKAVMTLRAES